MNKGLESNKYSKSDYTRNLLPLTRRKQFFDWLKLDAGLFIKIGFVLLLFSLPFIFTIALKNNFISSIEATEDINQKFTYVIQEFIFNIIGTVCLIFVSVGISGLSNILKLMSWSEPTMFKYDFFSGIKLNLKHNLPIFVIAGLIYSLVTLCSNFIGLTFASDLLHMILSGLLLGIFIFLFVPVFLMMFTSNSYYENNFFHNFINSFIIVTKYYFPICLSSVFICLLALLSFIGNIYIYLIVAALVTMFILPIVIFAWRLYALSLFDKHINQQFPNFLFKGLKKNGGEVK